MSIFYVGVPKIQWVERMTVPFFLSRNVAHARVKDFGRAAVPWAMDSGGFTEISQHGRWRIDAKRFVREVNFFAREIGNLQWTAPMDFMTESLALKKTGKSLREHQILTTENYLELASSHTGSVFIIPALQGDSVDDYLWHVEHYRSYGVDLRKEPLVGVGSMCRRQSLVGPRGGTTILKALHKLGLKMHAFGYKTDGLKRACEFLVSSDSMAWSAQARKRQTLLPGHDHPSAETAKYPAGRFNSCQNCFDFMLWWRNELIAQLPPKCVTIHPLLTSKHGLYRVEQEHKADVRRASGSWRVRGMRLLEQEAMFAQASEVLSINQRLDEAEVIEEDRDRVLGPNEEPGTYRAVPSPSLRGFLRAVPLEMVPSGTQALVRKVLLLPLNGDDIDAYNLTREPSLRWGMSEEWLRHHGYWVEDDQACPLGYQGPASGAEATREAPQGPYRLESPKAKRDVSKCMPKKKASATMRQRKFDKGLGLSLTATNVEGCDASTAARALRWG